MIKKIKSLAYSLLRYSEKWTKTDMVYLTKGGFWLTLGQIISSASGFILAIAFANLLPKETYGNYKFILSIFSILTIFTLPGINTALIQSIAKGYDNRLIDSVKIKIRWGLLGSLSTLALSIYYYVNGDYQLTIAMLIASIFLPIMDAFNLYGTLLSSKKNFKLSTKYNIAVKTIATISLLVTLFLSKNIFIILIVYFISNTLARLIFLILTIRFYDGVGKNLDKNLLSYGKKLTYLNIINNTVGYLDKILVFHYIGAVELAIYSIAIAPLDQIKMLSKNSTILALPKFSEKSFEIIKKTIFKKIFKFSFLLGIASVIYIILAPAFFSLVFPKYQEAVVYSQIFSLSLATIPLSIILSIFYAHKMTKQLYNFNIYTSLFKIVILFFSIYNFGLIGLVIARVIFQFFSLFYSIFLLQNTKNLQT